MKFKKIEKKKQKIRILFRKYRKNLTNDQKKIEEKNIIKKIIKHKLIQSSKNIGCFMSFDGEIPTNNLIRILKKNIYLPSINPYNQLYFLKYNKKITFKKNIFNIKEIPYNKGKIISIKKLDVVFVPIVAFDKRGYRLGMGGGFYDKLLLNWKEKNFYPIGLTYDFSFIEKLPTTAWDIPLPEIITPTNIWSWKY
ncbi:MAG: 5-formyltetrahydrofolate cyclo-ligase [Arsenophonus sp.]|nr:MAG: 5-formyltetrahydrofolate cyclo-ligase [Arsenophonus sp.]